MPLVPKTSPQPPQPVAPGHPAASPRVLIAFDPGRWKFRGVLRGVNRFATQFGGWQLMITRYHNWPLPIAEGEMGADGVLADTSEDTQSLLGRLHCPRVYLSLNPQTLDQTYVSHDYRAAGVAACAHLRDRGLRHLAVFHTGEAYRLDAQQLAQSFGAEARRTGDPVPVFTIGPRTLRRGRWLLDDQIADLAQWLAQLPQPVGLLAIDDEHAWRAIEAARLAGLTVPNDLCVLGVGDDDCLCDSALPAISSLALDYDQLGYEAARLLHAMMNGQPPPTPDPVAPLSVVERASTQLLAIDDPLVMAAVTMIRENPEQPPSVDHVAETLHTSRRTLYRRFAEVLGRTPGEEVRRARLEAARKLIVSTDLKLVAIAVRTGFPSISQLSRDVQKAYGVRPSELRRRSHTSKH